MNVYRSQEDETQPRPNLVSLLAQLRPTEVYNIGAQIHVKVSFEMFEYTEIKLGKQSCLYLSKLDAKRDWGHAANSVEGMRRMLQQEQSEDFVLATGETHPVREFVEKSLAVVGMAVKWEGSGVKEIGKDAETSQIIVRVNPKSFRPAEPLAQNPAKAQKKLGWKRKVDFGSPVKE
ncbi:hypothetical protein FRC04_009782 [Tulasnella sp. 424]|nr:hypothetical protein FRC04_009782 [Tulasnella sp. 424]